MSKFFLTNSKKIFDGVSANVKTSIFRKSFEYCCESVFALTTAKLDLQNVNYYSKANDFVFATGTLIFQESLNLENLFEKRNSSVGEIRAKSIGHYCICVKQDDELKLFGPAYATYDIYYYCANGIFLISNDLYTMSSVLGNRVSVNRLNVVEECIHTILGNETVFNEIKRLDGNEYICIKNNILSLIPLPYNTSLRNDKESKIAEEMASTLREKASVIYKNFSNPSICMTAGLDARISLATYLSIGAKPNLYYGMGNSFLTNTQEMDLKVDLLFEKEFNLNLKTKCWNTPRIINQDWHDVINRYGFYAYVYGGSNEIFDFFRKIEGPVVTFGYGGELYRNLDWIEKRKKDRFSINDFIDEYYVTGDLLKMVKDVPGFREHLLKKLLWIAKKYNLNPENMPNEANVFFLQEYRKTADTHLLNFVNLSQHCSLLLMESECVKYGMQSVEPLKKSKFMLSVINKLCPETLRIPVFSHTILRKYNASKGCLEKTMKNRIKDFLKMVIPQKLISLRKTMSQGKTAEIVCNQVRQMIDDISIIDKKLVLEGIRDKRDVIKSLIFHEIIGGKYVAK